MEAFGYGNSLTIRTGAPVILSPTSENFSPDDMIYKYKVLPCKCTDDHNHAVCPYAHPLEKARRRDVRSIAYIDAACPDFRKGTCKRGEQCPFAHGVFEAWLHPARYRTQLCRDGSACERPICFFAHSLAELREPEPVEPPPLVSETLAAKRAAKAAATAAGAHHHHQTAGLGRHRGGCCGSLSPTGPLSPTSSLTSLQEGHGAAVALHGLGCYPLGHHLRMVASSPRPMSSSSRPSSGRSARLPSPGVSDLWRSESAASLASVQSAFDGSFSATPVWSSYAGPQALPAALATGDTLALAQLLADDAALQRACGALPPLGPLAPGLGREQRFAAVFGAYPNPGGADLGGGSGHQGASGPHQHAFAGLRLAPGPHGGAAPSGVATQLCGQMPQRTQRAGLQNHTGGLAQAARQMQRGALSNAWPLDFAA